MTKLIALLALAGAVAAGVFFWRKNDRSWESMWSSTKETTSSWSETVANETSGVADTVSAAADNVAHVGPQLVDDVKAGGSQAHEEATEAVHRVAAAAEDATNAASDLAEEAEGGTG
jgi:gas vesicle protein